MMIEPAPDPDEIFWRNVGLPGEAHKLGRLLSIAATTGLCFFWTIPIAFLSSLTEVNSLKEKLPLLAKWIEAVPSLENIFALLAPLLLLALNEGILPSILMWFSKWEGHIAAPQLEASTFVKLSAFVVSGQICGATIIIFTQSTTDCSFLIYRLFKLSLFQPYPGVLQLKSRTSLTTQKKLLPFLPIHFRPSLPISSRLFWCLLSSLRASNFFELYRSVWRLHDDLWGKT
jgi:hypothetical protein